MAADFYAHRGELEREQHEIEQLMMPDTYRPRRHRDRAMPARAPRLTAVESRRVYTTETEPGKCR